MTKIDQLCRHSRILQNHLCPLIAFQLLQSFEESSRDHYRVPGFAFVCSADDLTTVQSTEGGYELINMLFGDPRHIGKHDECARAAVQTFMSETAAERCSHAG